MSDNFVVVGNIGDWEKFERLVPELIKYNPGLMLVTGGLGPVGQAYKNLEVLHKKYGFIVEVTPSPEDYQDGDLYRKYFGVPTAMFTFGGAKFISLDSSSGKIDDKAIKFLDRSLTSPSFIVTHYPPAVDLWKLDALKEGTDPFLKLLQERAGYVLGCFYGRLKTVNNADTSWVVGNATESYEISQFGYSRAGRTGGLAVLMKGGRPTFELINQPEAVV